MSATRPHRTQADRRAQMRGALIEQTIASIATHGYRATTTRQVANAAGASLGALAHHFPSRLDLIAAAIDEVGQRGVQDLHARADQLHRHGSPKTEQQLDLLWSYFNSDLFTVWIKVWLAAAEDPELYTRLAPIEARFNQALAAVAADLVPNHLKPNAWRARMTVAIHAMRGLALSLALEPRERPSTHNPWSTTRRELAALIDRSP